MVVFSRAVIAVKVIGEAGVAVDGDIEADSFRFVDSCEFSIVIVSKFPVVIASEFPADTAAGAAVVSGTVDSVIAVLASAEFIIAVLDM